MVVGHFLEFHVTSSGTRDAARGIAQLGVLLFFVLSGFLITGLLCRERQATGGVDLKRFYVRRVLRLAPALLLFLFTVIVLMRFRLITDVPKKELLECLLYSRNLVGRSLTLGHLWSLSLEEQFYLVWPLSFLLIPAKRAPTIAAWICAAFMIWRGLAIHASLFSYEQGIFYVRPYFRFDSILIGAFIALLLYSSAEIYHRLKRSALHSPAFALLVVLALWAAFGEDISRALYMTISELLVAAVLAHVVLAPQHRIAAALRNPWLRYFGTISYSLYLWQELFITANHPSWGTLRTLPLAILIPLTIAVTSYHVMEKPILRLKDRLVP